jgi:hypothetical protein
MQHNPENERIKRAYLVYLKEARRLASTPSMPRRLRSPSSKLTPDTVALKGFTYSRPSVSSANCPRRSAVERMNL